MEVLYGLHPVEEALRAGSRQFDHICVARERQDQRLQRVIDLCRERGVRLRFEPREHLTKLAKTPGHQGVVAVVLSPVAIKASAGAAEHVPIARVVNLSRALEQLKERNLWCVGLDERGTMSYDEFDFTSNCVLVLGREGAGLHDLVRRHCDHLLRIPMAGKVASLNVSVAGAVVLYEAARQRRTAQPQPQAVAAPKKKQQKGLGS
jgi:23S rRNA (guanosine2251-2'-O)-methyltransferase